MNTFVDQQALDRIRAEYLEMPGMKLTTAQLHRLCGVEQAMCTIVLDALVKAQFLTLKSDGTYVRLTEGRSSARRPLKAALDPISSRTTTRRAS